MTTDIAERIKKILPDPPENADPFTMYDGFDRFAFPGPVFRVTGGRGGETYLICGSEKTVLYDCGMAYCADVMLDNLIRQLVKLGRKTLDMVILSHSHYDHIGALPYVRKAFPRVTVCGSRHCAEILTKPSAHVLMKQLGENARDLYIPGSTRQIPVEGLWVDRILEDGDTISLGSEWITAYETKGHTDCSMTYLLQPHSLMFTSESTGIIEGGEQIHTPVLKDFDQALASADKCRKLQPLHLCLPHFGLVPEEKTEWFWDAFGEECDSKFAFVRDMMARGLTEEEMFEQYALRYWTVYKATEQPKEAYLLNSKYILKALLKKLKKEENGGVI